MCAKKKSTQKKLNNLVQSTEFKDVKDWQRALRANQARKETLVVKKVSNGIYGEYSVKNPMTNVEYKTVIRGMYSPWNYCSCMDFKTSGLGTCKHIEYVKQHYAIGQIAEPPYTSVYIDYKDGRKIKIRIGKDNREEFEKLASKYFTTFRVLRAGAEKSFNTFLREAEAIDETFRCYPDVIEYIMDALRREDRKNLLKKKYSDSQFDSLLTTKLFPYQKEGIRFAVTAGKSIIADEMGLGKTIQAIGTAELLRKEGFIENCLIVAPTSLKYQWKREIEKFTQEEAHVIEGPLSKRKREYNEPYRYKIISYNAISNDIKSLGKVSCDLLILDEVQRLKNWNTQISKAARKIESSFSVILSGTPLENKIEELYSIMEFADQFKLAPYYQFRQNHILTDEAGKVIGYQNLNDIGKKIQDCLIRRRKIDVQIQLPERMDKNLYVPMTGEQMAQHNELRSMTAQIIHKWRKMHFLSEVDRRRLLLLLSQMRMVCDSTFILDQSSRYDTKIDEVMDIINSIVENGDEKIVIFSQWERMTRLVAQEMDSQGIKYEYLHGGIPSIKRKELVNSFTDNPEVRVFLSTDAGSTGLNLQSGSVVINLDLPWNPAILEQRIARVYRIGQKKNIQVINLISIGTIEEQMLSKLRFKSSMFEGALDGGEDTVFINNEDKFEGMIQKIESFIEEPAETENPGLPETLEKEEKKESVEKVTETPEETATPSESHSYTSEDNSPEERTNSSKQLISDGISFLSQLSKTLQDPKATQDLIDNLVEEDPETGKTTLKIQVPSKESVSAVFTMLGKLFQN